MSTAPPLNSNTLNNGNSQQTIVIHGIELQLNSVEFRRIKRQLTEQFAREGNAPGAKQKRRLTTEKLEGKSITRVAQYVDMEEDVKRLLSRYHIYLEQIEKDMQVSEAERIRRENIARLQAELRVMRNELADLRRPDTVPAPRGTSPRRRSPARRSANVSNRRRGSNQEDVSNQDDVHLDDIGVALDQAELDNVGVTSPTGSDQSVSGAMGDMGMDEKVEMPDEIKVIFNSKECSICGVPADKHPIRRDNISVLRCGHVFHFFCAQKWYRYGNGRYRRHSCAICRNVDDDVSPYSSTMSCEIIGDVLLNQVLGPLPSTPPLFRQQQ